MFCLKNFSWMDEAKGGPIEYSILFPSRLYDASVMLVPPTSPQAGISINSWSS